MGTKKPRSRKASGKGAESHGAEKRSRTVDLFITNELLYQLSYFGEPLVLS